MDTIADPEAQDPGPRPYKMALAIAVATAVAYAGSLKGPFVYDDLVWITGNPSIRSLGSLNALFGGPEGSAVHGRPLFNLSLALNYGAGGEAPLGYHLANLLIHVCAALVLFGIARRSLALLPRYFSTDGGRTWAAFSAALLWALHPLQTESVTYVCQRSESLMGLFYFLTLYGFVRMVQSERPGVWRGLAVAACLAGMATKEVMMTAPVVVLLYDRTLVSGSFMAALRQRPWFYVSLVATWIPLALLSGGLAVRGVGFGLGISGWTYALVECKVVLHYLMLAVWPYPLVFDYGTEIVEGVGAAVPWACVVLALLAAVILAFRRRTATGFAALACLVLLAPTSSVVPVAFQPMAEHRMYLPLAPLMILAAAGSWVWLGRRSLALVLPIALALGVGTFLRNRDYRDEVALWSDTVLKRPENERARLALGNALAAVDRHRDAAQEFREALRLAPGDPDARLDLGYALMNLGMPDQALLEYQKIGPLSPDSALYHFYVALALDRMGRVDEAAVQYKKALELDPGNDRARRRLGELIGN